MFLFLLLLCLGFVALTSVLYQCKQIIFGLFDWPVQHWSLEMDSEIGWIVSEKIGIHWDVFEDLVKRFAVAFWATCQQSREILW